MEVGRCTQANPHLLSLVHMLACDFRLGPTEKVEGRSDGKAHVKGPLAGKSFTPCNTCVVRTSSNKDTTELLIFNKVLTVCFDFNPTLKCIGK